MILRLMLVALSFTFIHCSKRSDSSAPAPIPRTFNKAYPDAPPHCPKFVTEDLLERNIQFPDNYNGTLLIPADEEKVTCKWKSKEDGVLLHRSLEGYGELTALTPIRANEDARLSDSGAEDTRDKRVIIPVNTEELTDYQVLQLARRYQLPEDPVWTRQYIKTRSLNDVVENGYRSLSNIAIFNRQEAYPIKTYSNNEGVNIEIEFPSARRASRFVRRYNNGQESFRAYYITRTNARVFNLGLKLVVSRSEQPADISFYPLESMLQVYYNNIGKFDKKSMFDYMTMNKNNNVFSLNDYETYVPEALDTLSAHWQVINAELPYYNQYQQHITLLLEREPDHPVVNFNEFRDRFQTIAYRGFTNGQETIFRKSVYYYNQPISEARWNRIELVSEKLGNQYGNRRIRVEGETVFEIAGELADFLGESATEEEIEEFSFALGVYTTNMAKRDFTMAQVRSLFRRAKRLQDSDGYIDDKPLLQAFMSLFGGYDDYEYDLAGISYAQIERELRFWRSLDMEDPVEAMNSVRRAKNWMTGFFRYDSDSVDSDTHFRLYTQAKEWIIEDQLSKEQIEGMREYAQHALRGDREVEFVERVLRDAEIRVVTQPVDPEVLHLFKETVNFLNSYSANYADMENEVHVEWGDAPSFEGEFAYNRANHYLFDFELTAEQLTALMENFRERVKTYREENEGSSFSVEKRRELYGATEAEVLADEDLSILEPIPPAPVEEEEEEGEDEESTEENQADSVDPTTVTTGGEQ